MRKLKTPRIGDVVTLKKGDWILLDVPSIWANTPFESFLSELTPHYFGPRRGYKYCYNCQIPIELGRPLHAKTGPEKKYEKQIRQYENIVESLRLRRVKVWLKSRDVVNFLEKWTTQDVCWAPTDNLPGDYVVVGRWKEGGQLRSAFKNFVSAWSNNRKKVS